MKIYICGSHSTGKTTLAKYISQTYNIPMLPETARLILAEKELEIDSLRKDLDVVNSYQRSVLYRQIEQTKKFDNFVSDRAFDCLAYTAQHSTILSELIASQDVIDFIEFMKSCDSIIFFIRPSKNTLEQDGIRETITWDGIVAIDAQIKFMCEMFGIRYFQIDTDIMQERTRLVDAVLSLCPQ